MSSLKIKRKICLGLMILETRLRKLKKKRIKKLIKKIKI